MENYTKFALKPIDELESLLARAEDTVFVIACNKCYKEFTATEEPECKEFLTIAQAAGKHITGSCCVDFLCNKARAEHRLPQMIPAGTKAVVAISCGLGVQTVASVLDIPVYAGADSVTFPGHHGMALTKKACDACAQCYLNITGGICPIVDCSKSLVNGQCGGAKNGKCEVSPDKDCAWEKIQSRLAAQGRLEELTAQPVQLRDYNKVSHKLVQQYVKSIREMRFAGYYGGVHPTENKEFTEHLPLTPFPQPEEVVIPLSMHAGAPAEPVVQVGDHVKLGQKIGNAFGFISANVHSSVSGTVLAIEERPHANRGTCLSVVIANDKKDTLAETVKPADPAALTPEMIVEIVKEAGIVGMGGAGFPTNVKLTPPKPIDTVLLNGCECEPYLTADHRVLLEYADDVILGLEMMQKAVGAPKGIIVIEDNKPDAIALLEEKIADKENIEVCVAKTKYPQGAEKMLIKRVMGRQVPSGGLPADVGCVVGNVSTAKAIADAITKGMPLVERAVTVTGEFIKNPGNFMVRIGTDAAALVEYCGGITNENATVKMGGAMMGFPQTTLNVPIMKGSNGIIAIDTDPSREVSCIKCGRCVDVCPMELKPLYFAKFFDDENWNGFREQNVMDCMECRCCEYICSSKIPLVSKIKAGKNAVRGMK